MDVNLKATVFITQRTVREMKKRGKGKIINFSSIAGDTVAFPKFSIYGASKAAIKALTEGLAVELAPVKSNVNCSAPGNIRNPLNEDLLIGRVDAAD
ncbi:MAG: SDR family NAD(P)-dependent oxidoreductase [Syntrophaceae bacterium]|nr:SDR family NAD(P)-dependent oxidoreductase [Syntrophaceae bacterium]